MSPRWLHWPAAAPAGVDWTDLKDGVFDVTSTSGLWTMTEIEPCSTAEGVGGVDWSWQAIGGPEGCTGNAYAFKFYSTSTLSPEGANNSLSIIVWNGSSWSAKFTGWCNNRRVFLSTENGDFGNPSSNSIYVICTRIVTPAELAGFSDYA